MTNAAEWWDKFDDASNIGDGIREKISAGRGAEEEIEKFNKLRKELHDDLNDRRHVINLIHYNPGLFYGRIIKIVNVKLKLTKDDKEYVISKYNPLWGLEHQIGRGLIEEDVMVELTVQKDLQKQRLGMKAAEMQEAAIQQLNTLNEIQANGDVELEKIKEAEKEAKSKPVVKDGQKKKEVTEERLDNLEDSMLELRGRQEEMLEREKKELWRQSHNVRILKQAVRNAVRSENLDINQNLINEVTEIKQNQRERMSREAHTPNLGVKIEKMEGELAVIKENQLKRIARDFRGEQAKTDQQQDELLAELEVSIGEVREICKELKLELDQIKHSRD